MVTVGLIVPVYKNFKGFANLMHSVDVSVIPYVMPNWTVNQGVSAAWNDGLEQAAKRCDVAVVVNDDVTFFGGTIGLLAGFIRNKGFDLVTATNARDTKREDLAGYPTDGDLDFSCFAVQPDDFLNKFGLFDENFTPAYFEDNDMHYRLKLQGANTARLRFAVHHHVGSVTQNWGGEQVVTSPMFEKNRAYYVRKWGGTPGNELYTYPFGQEPREVWDW